MAITGSLQGDERRTDFLDALQEQFRAGDPLPFVADIVESSELEEVVIVGFEVVETDDGGDAVRYRLVLRQYVEPPPPPSGLPSCSTTACSTASPIWPATCSTASTWPGCWAASRSWPTRAEPIQPAMDTVRSAVGEVPALLGELARGAGGAAMTLRRGAGRPRRPADRRAARRHHRSPTSRPPPSRTCPR